MAGGLRFGGQRVSFEFVQKNPGCCIGDVNRACRRDSTAGHYWIYASVRRFSVRNLVLVAVLFCGSQRTEIGFHP